MAPLVLRFQGGELGDVRHLEAHLCLPLLRPGHIQYRYDLAGGATMDLGCYAINLARCLAGAEPEVIAARARLCSPHVDRVMAADLRFPDGRTGLVACSILSCILLRSRALVRGTRGVLRVSGPFHPQFYHRLRVTGERASW